MRWLTIAYFIAAICLFGWLAGTFGFWPALLAAFAFSLPGCFAWQVTNCNRPITRWEYGYIVVTATLAVVGTGFLVVNWYETGMDRRPMHPSSMFKIEYHAFRRRIANMPEYSNVEISYSLRKGGVVYLGGEVASKDSHDRLIQLIDEMIHHNEAGKFDRVDYPGKPAVGASRREVRTEDGDQELPAPEPAAGAFGNSESSPPDR